MVKSLSRTPPPLWRPGRSADLRGSPPCLRQQRSQQAQREWGHFACQCCRNNHYSLNLSPSPKKSASHKSQESLRRDNASGSLIQTWATLWTYYALPQSPKNEKTTSPRNHLWLSAFQRVIHRLRTALWTYSPGIRSRRSQRRIHFWWLQKPLLPDSCSQKGFLNLWYLAW